MKTTLLIAVFTAIALTACNKQPDYYYPPQTGMSAPVTAAPQDNTTDYLAAGAAGMVLGHLLTDRGPRSNTYARAPTTINRTIVNRTVIVQQPPVRRYAPAPSYRPSISGGRRR